MKNIPYRLFILILFLSFNSFSTNNENFEIDNYQNTEISQDWYAANGNTRNTDGEIYAISLRVLGYSAPVGLGRTGVDCLSVSKVKVRSDRGWQSTSYYPVKGESCTYYLNFKGKSYYFTI